MNQDALNQLALELPTRCIGNKFIFFTEINSTNDYARELLKEPEEKCPEGTTIVAGSQIRGRGQFDRAWYSPSKGGVYISVILRPPFHFEKALPAVSLMAGAAVAETLEGLASVKLALKYPNDIYLEGKKIGGILTERVGGNPDGSRSLKVILGVGVNLGTDPSLMPGDIKETASSLFHLSGQNITPLEFIRDFSIRLESCYGYFLDWNFSAIVECWKKRMMEIPEEAQKKLDSLTGLNLRC